MIKIEVKASFDKSKRRLNRATSIPIIKILNKYGKIGVEELEKATPKRTGLTSKSWHYKIENNGKFILNFYNTNIQNGVPVAIVLWLGHATKSGTYISGIDYINPAIKPVFEKLREEIKREGGFIR